MKRSNFIAFMATLVVPFVLSYTQSPSSTSSWFSVSEVADQVWCISDHGVANIYLVTGSDSALVIDTGIGAANLKGYIGTLTDLPLIVVNTHGHPDHAGANYQFSGPVYANPLDFEAIRSYDSPELRRNVSATMLGGAVVPEDEIFDDILDPKPVILKPVREGYTFNLGGRSLKVIEMPGHTAGEICLLDESNHLIFTGDNNNVLVWLHIAGCQPLEIYLASLKKEAALLDGSYRLMPGHGAPMPDSFVNDQIACVESILNGTCDAKAYESFAGNGMICTYGKASVAYNPDNLYADD